MVGDPRRFAVLVCIGASARELVRLVDLLCSLQHGEPEACAYVVLVNDGHDPDKLRAALQPVSLPIVHLINPRAGRGWGWAGGLSTGIFTGLRWMMQHGAPVDFVLKADTDTFIIGPFAKRIGAQFDADGQLGTIGHYINPNLHKTNLYGEWRRQLGKLLRPWSLWRNPHWHWRTTLWGRCKRVRGLMEQALARGYALGEFCSGGGYALSWAALVSLYERGWLNDVKLFLQVCITEDVMFAMLVRAAGFRLQEGGRKIFGTHESFFVTPEALLEEDCCILHPVKCSDEQQESAIRHELRRRTFQPAQIA